MIAYRTPMYGVYVSNPGNRVFTHASEDHCNEVRDALRKVLPCCLVRTTRMCDRVTVEDYDGTIILVISERDKGG